MYLLILYGYYSKCLIFLLFPLCNLVEQFLLHITQPFVYLSLLIELMLELADLSIIATIVINQ